MAHGTARANVAVYGAAGIVTFSGGDETRLADLALTQDIPGGSP